MKSNDLIALCLCFSAIGGSLAFCDSVAIEPFSMPLEASMSVIDEEAEYSSYSDFAVTEKISTPAAHSFTLSISDQEKKDITYIISELGRASRMKFMKRYSYLAKEHASLDKAGDRIANVSVMQFLAFIFSESSLKEDMRAMCDCDELPWKTMRKNTIKGLKTRHARGEIMPELEGFCAYVGVNYQKMKGLAEKGDWRGFLYALF